MICKWCGAELSKPAGKCARCGKAAAALSDCGGFYDLVPGAQRQTPLVSEKNAQEVKCGNDDPKGKKGRGKALQLILTSAGLVLIVILLLSLNSKLKDSLNTAERLDEQLENVRAELRELKESANPAEDNSLPETDQMGKLVEQDIHIDITVEQTEQVTTVQTVSNLDETFALTVGHVSFDKRTESLAAARIDLGLTENCLGVEVNRKFPTDAQETAELTVKINADDVAFAKMEGAAEYVWECRISGTEEWKAPDEAVFTVSEDGATVSYSPSALAQLLAEAETVEFRLTYKRSNAQGGSLTVLLSGIFVNKQTAEIES